MQICKKSTQFQGYEQQDAHELLRCLLDAIRNEEILRAKRAILKAFALSEKTDPNTVSPRLKTMIKGYGKQATHTLVDHIFGGHLISTGELIWQLWYVWLFFISHFECEKGLFLCRLEGATFSSYGFQKFQVLYTINLIRLTLHFFLCSLL